MKMKHQIVKSISCYIGILIGILCLVSINFSGCNKIENKKYIAEKVVEMYAGSGEAEENLKKAIQALSNAKTMSEINVARTMANQPVEQFNNKCEHKISNDPILKGYFESFCKRMEEGKTLSIETLNYYGYKTRIKLEKDLDIILLSNNSQQK